jgi:amino acid adenylation domain-containing protein
MNGLLHSLLEKSSRLYPEKIAVTYDNERISYRQLNLLSDQLSACLIEHGVKTGSRVGIYLDKSIDAVVVILGILKSGACYVPLDPCSPPARLEMIIKDCSFKYLVTSSKKTSFLKQLPKKNKPHYLFFMDTERKGYQDELSGVKPVFKEELARTRSKKSRPVKASDLAYILYTSGSSGRPKGVMITHKASLAFVDWACGYLGVTQADHLSAHAPFHFDLSIFDIFVAFKAGATLHIVPQGISAFANSLAGFIETKKISIWYSVPSAWIYLLLYGNLKKRNLSSLKKIIFAGEVFPVKYLKSLMHMLPAAQYYNFYGPTETNVCAYYHVRSVPKKDEPVPIGKPCAGQKFFVVNEAGEMAQGRQCGELYVRGPTLMKGYYNDLRGTRDVFLSGLAHSKGRVYKTGDFVRRGRNGNLIYCGRRDGMIKSRGYRIEPGEIEAILSSHEKIKEVAVVGVPDEKIGKKIKAFIVVKAGRKITVKEINLFCLSKLPLYMVPEVIVFKGGLPRTSNGKIDRKKLEAEA